MKKIVVMASGGGGNFKYLIDSSADFNFEVIKLITNKKCKAEEVAKLNGIDCFRLTSEIESKSSILEIEQNIPSNIDCIVLAGFMPILPKGILELFPNKFINTHPSLLPNHGGKGMFGVRVQESVIFSGDEFAGCTVHRVNEQIDKGEILMQQKFRIPNDMSPWNLGKLVFEIEGPLLARAIKLYA